LASQPESAGDIYAEIVERQLAVEQERKASLESRGLSVVTSAGALTALLLGVLSVLTRADATDLPIGARWCLAGAALAFVAAAALALKVNAPRLYPFLSSDDMRRMVTADLWEKAPSPAKRRVTENLVAQIEVYRKLNEVKARALTRALLLETAGVTLTATAVVWRVLTD
jgi:hypothetical protein